MQPGTYSASITVDTKAVTIHGYGATLNAASNSPSLHLGAGARARILGLKFVNLSDMNALDCYPGSGAAAATLELDEVSVDAMATAVMAYPCTVTITRSRLQTRKATVPIVYALPTSSVTIDRTILEGGAGIQAEGSASFARITNSVIANQASDVGAFMGTNAFGQGPGAVTVSFSTVINSLVKCGSASPRCAGGTDVGSCMNNTIVFNGTAGAPSNTVQGACAASYSLVFPQSAALTGSNNQLGVNPMFKDFAGGNYHLSPGSPAIDAADPTATNAVDFDGVARPQGMRSDIGAFEVQ